jgi:hypothetical protein
MQPAAPSSSTSSKSIVVPRCIVLSSWAATTQGCEWMATLCLPPYDNNTDVSKTAAKELL